MFEKKIKFITHPAFLNEPQELPKPIKFNLPDWYKKLKHKPEFKNIKGCIPFFDALTFGYVLPVPQDFVIKHNFTNKDKDGKEFQDSGFKCPYNHDFPTINLNSMRKEIPDIHPTFQLEGSPLIEKNKNLAFYKIINPWIIQTPPGYSCLFVPPLNNEDDRFSIISGIVDTDTFNKEVNFPIVINGDKYPTLETVIKKGTPYVQVIPFKRDNWKMEIETKKNKDLLSLYPLRLINTYKLDFWRKKKCN